MGRVVDGVGFRSLPVYETFDVRYGGDAGEGGGQLAFEDTRRYVIGYLGGRVRFLIGIRTDSFFRQVHEFLEQSMRVGAVNVFENHQGTIKLATNNHACRRTKHIDVKHHLTRDACDAVKVKVAYIRSEDHHANLLTKPLHIIYKHAKVLS